jgi:hypothetical protein
MKKRILLAAISSATLILGIPLSASAAPGETTATLEVTAGSLTISVPSTTANLGTRANSVGGGDISGTLGVVQVRDARSAAAGAGWVASVISTTFVPTAGTAIAASAVTYVAGTITKVGTATYVGRAAGAASIEGASVAVTATGITGDNSASWNPAITVAVPGGADVSVYTATITHSVV